MFDVQDYPILPSNKTFRVEMTLSNKIIRIIFLILLICQFSNSTVSNDVLTFLQRESSSVSASKSAVEGFLLGRGIYVGNHNKPKATSMRGRDRIRIALSTDDNNLECRVALCKAVVGSKVIAPCRCSGSQEWVQFSELNRLRRRDPKQWTICPTCQAKFDFSIVRDYGGVVGNIVTMILDNKVMMRSVILCTSTILGIVFKVHTLFLRLLTSKVFWNLYPQWSKIVHLPLVLKYWGGKILLQYLARLYLNVESYFCEHLATVETALVEPGLPVEDEEEGIDIDIDESESGDIHSSC